MGDILYGLVAVLLGVAGSYLLFWLLNALLNFLPEKIAEKFNVLAFITPAAFLLLIVLVYPFVQTINWSFRANTRFQEWVGFENYVEMLGDASFYSILLNNFLWVMFVPAITVFFGTMVATLSNNVGPRREKVFKSLIFMPMSISLIAASTIWSYMYVYSPPGRPVIGFFNALAEGAGFESQPWLTISTFHLNSFMLMAVVVWLQTGYAMVIISAAIKAVPEETLEAARIDGANAYQIFMRVILPQVWGTVMAVFITTLIMVMKIFDVVLAMTGGNFDTKVLAYEWYIQFFEAGKLGNASAIVMVLTLLITPLMWLQIRTVRQQEMLR